MECILSYLVGALSKCPLLRERKEIVMDVRERRLSTAEQAETRMELLAILDENTLIIHGHPVKEIE